MQKQIASSGQNSQSIEENLGPRKIPIICRLKMKHSDINTTRQNKLNKTFLFIHVEMEFFTFIALVVRHVGFRNICIVINLSIYIRYHMEAS